VRIALHTPAVVVSVFLCVFIVIVSVCVRSYIFALLLNQHNVCKHLVPDVFAHATHCVCATLVLLLTAPCSLHQLHLARFVVRARARVS
jgi:hypothetical protein